MATQRKFAKTWQMHRSNKEATKEETDAVKPDKKEEVRCCVQYTYNVLVLSIGGEGRSKVAHSDKITVFPDSGCDSGDSGF